MVIHTLYTARIQITVLYKFWILSDCWCFVYQAIHQTVQPDVMMSLKNIINTTMNDSVLYQAVYFGAELDQTGKYQSIYIGASSI